MTTLRFEWISLYYGSKACGNKPMVLNEKVTSLDVTPFYADVTVPVRSALLVPEPQRVHRLVHDGTNSQTAATESDS